MRIVLGLLIACWLSPLLAQPAGDSPPQQPGEAAATQPETPASTEHAPDRDTSDAAQAKPARDPSDYQASEQISEELSVSFPADI